MPNNPPTLTSGSMHSEASEWDELEARSLAFAEMDGPQERLITHKKKQTALQQLPRRITSQTFRLRNVIILVFLSIAVFMATKSEDVLAGLMMMIEEEHEITLKDTIGEMVERVQEANIAFHELLDEEYGEYKDRVFNKETILKSVAGPSKLSYKRLQRRILIKILQAQLTKEDVSFNWVIGGHSAAAGHGNLFNQTYGYVLEDSVKPIFEALGVQFYGKNYAMGGMKSAPESALCMSSLYGLDLDVLSWDFGMTDGSRSSDLYNIWSQKAGTHPTQPTLVSYGSIAAKTLHAKLEEAGMSAFEALFVEDKRPEFLAGIFPDSDDEDIEVDDLPKGVKYYRCNGHTENGELCGDKLIKFDTKKACQTIGYQVDWHNGWKDHLLKGRVSAAFLIQQVFEALKTLERGSNDEESMSSITPQISLEYLNYLLELEGKDKALFRESEVPRVHHFEGDLEEHHDSFMRSKSVCHYGYLPSYARFEGLVTENPQTLTYEGGGRTSYVDEGEDYAKPGSPKPDNDSPPRLVYNYKGDRNICSAAEFDFKDFFSVRNEDKSVVTVVPNDSENEAFSEDEDWKDRLGLITLCEIFFAFKREPQNYFPLESMFNTTETTIIVNDVPVTNITRIGTINSYCYVLRHEEGFRFPSSDDKHGLGRYEIKFQVPKRGSQLYLSSFIVI